MKKLQILIQILGHKSYGGKSLISLAAELTGRHKNLINSGRWIIDQEEPKDRDSRNYYKYRPIGMEGWESETRILRDPDTGRSFQGREVFWDPNIGEMKRTEDKWGTEIKITPRGGWIDEIPQNESLIYRGISSEEMDYIKSSGQIQSSGNYNLGDEQIVLTYFSTDSSQAKSYAHGFAPTHLMATPNKPAFVIAIPKRDGKMVAGTGSNEVGIIGPIPASEIKEIWIGEAYALYSLGSFDTVKEWGDQVSEGSSSATSIGVAWRRIK